jgi:hypothetical protein
MSQSFYEPVILSTSFLTSYDSSPPRTDRLAIIKNNVLLAKRSNLFLIRLVRRKLMPVVIGPADTVLSSSLSPEAPNGPEKQQFLVLSHFVNESFRPRVVFSTSHFKNWPFNQLIIR